MKNMLQKNTALFVFICIILIQLSVHVYLQNWPVSHTPSGHVAIINADDSYYISVIRQSKDGAWKFKEPHTTRPTTPIIVYVFYIVAGKVASILHIDPILMYSVLRILGSVTASVATFVFISTLLPKTLHILGVLFAFCVETGPPLRDIITSPITSWTASATGRTIMAHQFDSAHHRFAEAIGIILLTLFITRKKPITLPLGIVVAILTIVGVLSSPSAMGVLTLTIYIPLALYTSISTRTTTQLIPTGITIGIIAIMGLWMSQEFSSVAPWNAFNKVESAWFSNTTILTQYLHSMLFYIPWIGLYIASKIHKKIVLTNIKIPFLMILWILLPAILIYVKPSLPWLSFANWRIAWGTPTIPFAILATYGAQSLIHLFPKSRSIAYSIIGVFFLFSFLVSVQFTSNIINAKTYERTPQIYPPKDLLESFHFLNTLPKDSGILTAPTYGEVIPAFANVRTFIGPPHAYADWDDRNWLSYYFFSRKKTVEQAREILMENDISYVYYGPEEQSYGDPSIPLYPTLLTPVYTLPRVTIFQVIPTHEASTTME